jgi:hypothetical protein
LAGNLRLEKDKGRFKLLRAKMLRQVTHHECPDCKILGFPR